MRESPGVMAWRVRPIWPSTLSAVSTPALEHAYRCIRHKHSPFIKRVVLCMPPVHAFRCIRHKHSPRSVSCWPVFSPLLCALSDTSTALA